MDNDQRSNEFEEDDDYMSDAILQQASRYEISVEVVISM